MVARVFTAHPLASRMGARLRLRSLKYARTMDGPEMRSIKPTMAMGICHQLRLRNPVRTDAIAVPMAPMARPMAAKIPANFPTSNGASAGGFPASAVAAAPDTWVEAASVTFFWWAPATFSICSCTILAICL